MLCSFKLRFRINDELENYLGYESNYKVEKASDNRRNGYSSKKVSNFYGLSIPCDRNSDFESMLIPKTT